VVLFKLLKFNMSLERIRLLVHILRMIIQPWEKQCATVQKLGLNIRKLDKATMESTSNWFNDKEHPENAAKQV
jgi:isochorismate hydrolase